MLTEWEIIERANWKDFSNKHNDRGLELSRFSNAWVNQFCNDDLIRASKFARQKYSELNKVIDAYERNHGRLSLGGDDSYSDALYTVVGLGKDTFEKVMADPATILEIKSKESFSYLLFDNHDAFCKYDPFTYTQRAYSLYGELEIGIIDKEVSKKDKDVVNMKQRLYALVHGNIKAATEGFDTDYITMYDAIGDKFGYGFANTLGDAYKYIIMCGGK